MKFQLDSVKSCHRYPEQQDEIQILEALGFKFFRANAEWEPDPDGPLMIRSTEYGEVSIEINTLEELLELADKLETTLVVGRGSIMIYNDYME